MATYNGHQEDSSGNYLLAIPNSMVTQIETGSTASQAYTKGTYFYFNNRLVKATTAIASGDTLTVGTNVGYANAADELTAHLRANDTNKSEFYFDVKDVAYGFYPSASKTASEFVPFGGTKSIIVTTSGVESYSESLAGKTFSNVIIAFADLSGVSRITTSNTAGYRGYAQKANGLNTIDLDNAGASANVEGYDFAVISYYNVMDLRSGNISFS